MRKFWKRREPRGEYRLVENREIVRLLGCLIAHIWITLFNILCLWKAIFDIDGHIMGILNLISRICEIL